MEDETNRREYVGRNFLLWLIIITMIIIFITVTGIVLSTSTWSISTSLTVIPHGNIVFDPNIISSYQDEVSALNSFMAQYNATYLNKKGVYCSEKKSRPKEKFCYYDPDWIYSLCPPLNWNFHQQPCVLLTLWSTKYLQTYENLGELPKSMPNSLREFIKIGYLENGEIIPKNIWLSCTHAARYTLPVQGFPAYYFPSQDYPNYLPPVVGVLLNLEANKMQEIECQLWARNINHTTDGFATVKFNVFMSMSNATKRDEAM